MLAFQMQHRRQEREERIGRAILKLESPTDERRCSSLTPAGKYAFLLDWLLWHEVLKSCHRCFGVISHSMGMTVRKDHQVTFGEQHGWHVYPVHGQPARSSSDDMEAGNRSFRHTESPGCAQRSAAIQRTVQVY